MIRLACAFIFALSTQVSAEVIQVQSGDHAGFTRLVMAIPAGRDWRLGRLGAGYAVESGDTTDSFDFTSVFELIGRNRLAALATGARPGRLNLTLACSCHATAFRWQSDWVVIDIFDGPAPSESPFEIALNDNLGPDPLSDAASTSKLAEFEIARPKEIMADFSLSQSEPERQNASPRLVLPLVLDGQAAADLPATLPVSQLPPLADPASEAGHDRTSDAQISATEQAIIESFARAASQGLLDVSTSPDPMTETNDHQVNVASEIPGHMTETHNFGDPQLVPDHVAEPSPSSLAVFGLRIVDPDQPGIRSHTSFDLNAPLAEPPDPSTPVGDRCLDASLFDMEGWGDDRDFSTQISEKLSGLTTEFDVYPEGAIESLVRTYIFFGLGQEALQALKLDGVDSQQRRVLASLAHVADEEPDPSGLLDSQLGCATQAAIWTVLSRGTLAGTTETERVAAAEGFRTLPPMLRGHLGVTLAQIFIDFGDPDSAGNILEAARDHVTAERVETEVTAAEITLVTQGTEAAIPALESLAQADIRLTPPALVQLINLTLDDGQQLDPSLITLADSMVYENRGDPVAADLIAAQARALIAISDFEQVFSLLARDEEPMELSRLIGLRSAAILALTDRVDDAAFLNFAFDTLPETGNPAVENVVSGRLLALGFADRAGQILTTPATGVEARDRRYLEAEIAIETGHFVEVEGLLAGMSDPRAVEITARALAAQGDFAAATSTQDVLPGTAADPAEAWRAGEWSVLGQSDDPLLRAASDAALAPAAELDPESPLAASRALLEQATATQDLAGQLLDRFAVDPATSTPGSN